MGGGAAKSRLSSIPQKCAILLHEKSANMKIILVFRGGGGAAILQLSREDKICAIFILQGFLSRILLYNLVHIIRAGTVGDVVL